MNYRKERIERLVQDLEAEMVKGIREGDITQCLQFQFAIPTHDKTYECQFRMRSFDHDGPLSHRPNLRVVK